MRVTVIEQPTAEPVSLAEAKAHMRVDLSDDDALIEALITAARQWVESVTNRAIGLQLIEVAYPRFMREVELPRPPLRSVVGAYYRDQQGVDQTVDPATYRVIPSSDNQPAMLEREYQQAWPSPTYRSERAVWVRYYAGWDTTGSPADIVPAAIKQAILLVVADMYEHREAMLDAQTYENVCARRLLAVHAVPSL
jgi:uncharacterized phiE125 gp8 family phage protein